MTSEKIIKFLIQSGAKVNYHNKAGDRALTYACFNQDVSVLELLLKSGASVDYKNAYNQTILETYIAQSVNNHQSLVIDKIDFLLKHGAVFDRKYFEFYSYHQDLSFLDKISVLEDTIKQHGIKNDKAYNSLLKKYLDETRSDLGVSSSTFEEKVKLNKWDEGKRKQDMINGIAEIAYYKKVHNYIFPKVERHFREIYSSNNPIIKPIEKSYIKALNKKISNLLIKSCDMVNPSQDKWKHIYRSRLDLDNFHDALKDGC